MLGLRTLCLLVAMLGSLGSGCSLFSHYPEETAPAQEAFRAGDFERCYGLFKEGAEEGEADALAWVLDAALAAHTGGLYDKSIESFDEAQRLIDAYEAVPAASGRTVVESAGALLVNDKALPYDGETFERVLVPTYQSLNYLFKGDPGNSFVLARRALEVQEEEERRLERDWEIEPGSNPTMNLFSRYMIGLAYEDKGTSGDLSNALISYQQMAELWPEGRAAKKDILRLLWTLGRRDEFEQRKREWNVGEPPIPQRDEGEIVFLYQCGVSPQKTYKELFQTSGGQSFKFPVPEYADRPNPVDSIEIRAADRKQRTEVVEPLNRTARRSLEDRMPAIYARAAIRIGIKAGAATYLTYRAATAEDDTDRAVSAIAAVAAWIWLSESEQPDLRSWITLPKNIQSARIALPPGTHDLELRLLDRRGQVIGTSPIPQVEVQPRHRVYINLRSWDTRLFYARAGGGRPRL